MLYLLSTLTFLFGIFQVMLFMMILNSMSLLQLICCWELPCSATVFLITDDAEIVFLHLLILIVVGFSPVKLSIW